MRQMRRSASPARRRKKEEERGGGGKAKKETVWAASAKKDREQLKKKRAAKENKGRKRAESAIKVQSLQDQKLDEQIQTMNAKLSSAGSRGASRGGGRKSFAASLAQAESMNRERKEAEVEVIQANPLTREKKTPSWVVGGRVSPEPEIKAEIEDASHQEMEQAAAAAGLDAPFKDDDYLFAELQPGGKFHQLASVRARSNHRAGGRLNHQDTGTGRAGFGDKEDHRRASGIDLYHLDDYSASGPKISATMEVRLTKRERREKEESTLCGVLRVVCRCVGV